MVTKNFLRKKYQKIKRILTERTRRLWCASEALAIGKGGIALIHAVTQVSRPTIYAGIRELRRKSRRKKSQQRIRKKGGGAKLITQKTPMILQDLEELVESATRGDPMSYLLWTSKSLRKIARELQGKGYHVCHNNLSFGFKNLMI